MSIYKLEAKSVSPASDIHHPRSPIHSFALQDNRAAAFPSIVTMQPLLLLVAPLWVATLGLTSPTPDNPNNVLSVSLRDLGHDQQSPRSTSSIASQAADESLNKRGGSSSRPEPARLPDSDLVWRDRHGVDDLLTQWDSILKNSLEASSSSSVKHNIPTELERDFLYFFLASALSLTTPLRARW